ncbi:hypothetical protein Poli38472_013454 [Pythium oligandrum]|uniref:Uncharacterized protein n=1 Tax=Pythium oligandrum TaxID=41045 RepID=A0A8K1C814_PYTOL|nr:hypothetical protein Poli38472_013454 [Pythium oligandrum]|eukprot:TMW57980.1 hypothetical protein Poli38472_013454 [Pythium oligandrum]
MDMEAAQDIEDMLRGDEISLVQMETIEFIDYQEIVDAAENVYLRPVSKNFQSVDSIIKPAALFQVTGAHKHPCKQKGLHDVLSELGNPTHPRLYFVVPPDRFTSFRYQPYLNAKGKAMREPTYVNVRRIQQFALQVEITL